MPHALWTPRVNGCWVQTDQQDFWQLNLTVQDPPIPNLPLESPAGGLTEADGSANGVAASAVATAAIWNSLSASTGLATDSIVGQAIWNALVASTGAVSDAVVGGTVYGGGGTSAGIATDAVAVAAIWNTLFASAGAVSDIIVGVTIQNFLAAASGLGSLDGTGVSLIFGSGFSEGLGISLGISEEIFAPPAPGISVSGGGGGVAIFRDTVFRKRHKIRKWPSTFKYRWAKIQALDLLEQIRNRNDREVSTLIEILQLWLDAFGDD